MINLPNILTSFKIDSDPTIPSFDELKKFLLVEKEKGSFELIINGHSANKREIFFVKIGRGKKNIAITGGAHADEPFKLERPFFKSQFQSKIPKKRKYNKPVGFHCLKRAVPRAIASKFQ